ncbi:YigZ family protein [Riemerella columbina]|uniref:YigZ family protein n=1 Tax=Riemerella columbina TaxID=103810 RepID=UPI00035E3821|nr:YigZ family protein [Riemerella columbina]
MENYSYNTIKQPVVETILKEKGSKFLGYAYPVKNEEEIKQALESIKTDHPKATHHCYAYRLGLEGEDYRANDDGEPSGSAGLPIYNQILSSDLTNILVVVVRYYGGTKLGVGGLVKTYKESAKLTLEKAKVVTKELESTLELTFPFNLQNVAFTILNRFDTQIINFDANENCQIIAQIKTSQKEQILEQFLEHHQIETNIRED